MASYRDIWPLRGQLQHIPIPAMECRFGQVQLGKMNDVETDLYDIPHRQLDI